MTLLHLLPMLALCSLLSLAFARRHSPVPEALSLDTVSTVSVSKVASATAHPVAGGQGGEGGLWGSLLEDHVHRRLWKALEAAQEVPEQRSFGEPGKDLSLRINGRVVEKGKRPGRVNSNRLLLVAQWEVLKSEHFEMFVNLTGEDGTSFLPTETIPPCNGTNTTDCVLGGMAYAYSALPNHTSLKLHFHLKVPQQPLHSEDCDIQTADASSGDAQAKILFLNNMNHSEYKEKWTSSKFVFAQQEEKFVSQELTIFDLEASDLTPKLETNGFELDSSGKLQEPIAELLKDAEGDEIYTAVVLQRESACKIEKQSDLTNVSAHFNGSVFTGGRCAAGGESLYGYKIAQICEVNPDNMSDLNCTVSENLTGLVAPVKLWLRQEIERNTTHAEAVYQGVAMSLLAEYQRAPIFEMIKQHFEPTAGLEKLLEVMQASMERGEKLVQTVEDASETWWKERSGVNVTAACFSMNYRHTRAGMKGLPIAHVDATSVKEWFKEGGAFPPSSWKRFEEKLGMNVSEALKHTVLTFNEWVNAGKDPIVELPLTMLDTTTVEDSDLETAWVQLSLDSMSLRWTPKQQWYYKELKRGEGYRFITSPHEGPEGVKYVGTPHSAFRFVRKDGLQGGRPRESYEFRCLLVDPTWTHDPKEAHEVPTEPTDDIAVKEAAGEIITAIMSKPGDIMNSMVDDEDFQES